MNRSIVRASLRRVVSASAVLALAACSGGARSLLPATQASPAPSGGGVRQSMRVTIAIPVASHASAERKHPAFVVSATAGLEISAVDGSSVRVADQTYDVSSSSPDCTTSGGTRSCTLGFLIPIGGPYVVTLVSYDQAPVGGMIPAGANELARGVMTGLTIVQGVANAFSATLAGTAASLSFGSNLYAAVATIPGATAVPVGVTDASGTSIVGALSSPLTASVVDSGGHTLLSVDGGTTRSASVELDSSTDAANLTAYYDGAAGAGYSATLSVSATGATGASSYFSVLGVGGSIGFGTPRFAAGAADFTAPAQQLVLAPSEPHFTGTITKTADTCAGFVTVAPSGAEYTATSVLPTASCRIDFSDGTLTVSVPVSVTTTAGSIGIPPPRGTVDVVGTLSGSMIPDQITAGPDGALWFVADDGDDSEFGRAGTDGSFAEYPIPTPGVMRSIGVGPDGRLWAGDAFAGTLAAIDPSTHAVTTYDISANTGSVAGIVAGPDGNLWLTDPGNNNVERYSTDGTFVGAQFVPFSSAPTDIIEGPDGAMWFGDLAGRVGRIDPTTLVQSVFPTDNLAIAGVGRMTVGADGAIWMTSIFGGGLGRMTTLGAFTFYPTGATVPAYGLASAPDNTLWFGGCGCGVTLDTLTTGGAEQPLNIGDHYPEDLAAGSDGGIWFIDDQYNTVGRIQP